MKAAETNFLVVGNAFADRYLQITDAELATTGITKGHNQITERANVEETYTRLTGKQNGHLFTPGGSGSNVAKGLALLYDAVHNPDVKISLLGRVGNDMIGTHFIDKIKNLGIEFLSRISDTATGLVNCFVTTGDKEIPDDRTMQCFLGAATEFCVKDTEGVDYSKIDYMPIEGYNVLYGNDTDGYTLSTLIDKARAANPNVKISLDLADIEIIKWKRDHFLAAAKKVDILFGNISEYIELFGEKIQSHSEGNIKLSQEFYDSFGEHQTIVVTKGALGSEGIKESRKAVHVDAEKVVGIKDLTGGGDAFAAGFIYGFSQGLSMEKCLRIGTKLASEIICTVGTDLSLEQKEKVVTQMRAIAADGGSVELIEQFKDTTLAVSQ